MTGEMAPLFVRWSLPHWAALGIVALGWLLYVIVAQKFMTTKMSEISIYVTIAFLILWCGLLLCLQKSGFKKSVLAFAVIAMCFSEVIVSDCSSILITQVVLQLGVVLIRHGGKGGNAIVAVIAGVHAPFQVS